MIKATYVTFEQAKLLKEKGFDNISCTGYYFGTDDCVNVISTKQHKTNNKCLAPEQWQVVEWLRINHGIWVEVVIYENKNFESEIYITKNPDVKHIFNKPAELYNSPQEAYSAAFDYVLKNLLK